MANDMIIRNGINYSHDSADSISFDNTRGEVTLSSTDVQNVIFELFDKMYPVGTIYMSVNNVNPGTLFGGTWEAWGSGKVPVGVDSNDTDFDTVEETGGTKSVTLTSAQSGVPAHAHGLNSHTHSIGAHSHGLNSHTHTLNSHTHTVGAHSHGLNSHKHSVGAHSHGLNSHTHTIAHNHGALLNWSRAGSTTDTFYVGSDSSSAYSSYTTARVNTPGSSAANTGAASGSTANSTAFDTGAASGSTANSAAFNTGAATGNTGVASGNTANSTAFDSGAATGNTANNTAANASESHTNLQPYITCYMWKRTA